MKFVPEKKELVLNGESVDYISEDVEEFLISLKTQKKNILTTRLTVEEILLEYLEKFDDKRKITYIKNNFLGKPYITINIEGEPFNPLERKEDVDEFGAFASNILQNADYAPSYSFDKGVNSITMRFSKKGINPIIKMIIAIISAILVSLLSFVLPKETVSFIKENLLTPLYNAFLGLMATVEFPLVFFSITCGIIGIGDSTVFGKIGRKMVMRFVGVIVTLTAFSGAIFAMMFTKLDDRTQTGVLLKGSVEMLLDIVPKSLIDPFTSGNTMQVVLFAIVTGVAVVVLGSRVKGVSKLIYECNRIVVYITEIICRMLPFFIFVIILNLIWSENLDHFKNMWKPIVAYIVVLVSMFILMFIYVAAKENVKFRILGNKMLQTFLIGLGTASSTALNGECSESLYRRMGANKRFVEFGQPVGSVIFMPSTSINFMVFAVYMASYYDIKVSLLWIMIAVLVSTFVAIATPPVPGGAIAAYTIIFAQLGIPQSAVAIAISLDLFFDFIATAFDSSFLQLELIRQADLNKMLDYDILRKDDSKR